MCRRCGPLDEPAGRQCPFTFGPSPQRNEWDKVSTLILNSYIACGAAERASRGLLDVRMREAGEVQVSMVSLRRLCREDDSACPTLERVLGKWMRLRDQVPATHSAADWSRTFSALLNHSAGRAKRR